MKLLWLFLISVHLWGNLLQNAIDKAKPFSIITLGKGVYKGNIVISKPLILKGEGKKSIIDGRKKGSVVIKSKNVTIKNLTVRGDGLKIYYVHNSVVKNNLYKYNEASIMLMVAKTPKLYQIKYLAPKGLPL